MTGTIRTVKEYRGFGFIKSPEHRGAIFFHQYSCAPELLPFDDRLVNRRVAFKLEETIKGPKAKNVRPA